MPFAAPRVAELVAVFDGAVLDVRYIGPGQRFCVGPTASAHFAWPEAIEIVRVETDGSLVPPALAEPLAAADDFEDEAPGFQVTLGRLCFRVRATEAPPRHPLSPRFSTRVGVALLPLLVAFTGLGFGAMGGAARGLAIDPSVAQRVRVTLDLTPRHDYAPPRPSRHPRVVREAPSPFATGQDWVGTYFCPQGETSLVLRITAVREDEIEARFIFDYAHTSRGAYALVGHYSRVDRHATFAAGAWEEHPPGYYTVGLDGTASRDAYQGRIVGPGCSTFSLRRAG